MSKERRIATVFLILGICFNSLGTLNKNDTLKISFIGAGTLFLIIAVIRFLKIRKNEKKG